MVKVDIIYICDKCGKEQKEETIIKADGYEDINYLVENEDSAYMPDGWIYSPEEEILLCEKCDEEQQDGSVRIAIA